MCNICNPLLPTVKAVMVSTVAFDEVSAARPRPMQKTSPNTSATSRYKFCSWK